MGLLFEQLSDDDLARAAAGLLRLSPGEVRALRTMLRGKSSAEAGRELGISRRTVEVQLAKAFAKCGVDNRITMTRLAALLENDPAVAAYLAALPERAKGRSRKDGTLY